MTTAHWDCGGSNWLDFEKLKDRFKKLDFVNPKKLDDLYYNIELKCCLPHDDKFWEGGGILDFWRANYVFVVDMLRLLHWTSVRGRFIMFVFVFTPLNILWLRHFNFTCVWKKK